MLTLFLHNLVHLENTACHTICKQCNHCMDGIAYFVCAVSDAHDMFMKCITGLNVIKLLPSSLKLGLHWRPRFTYFPLHQ
jgi:hypothetical protein